MSQSRKERRQQKRLHQKKTNQTFKNNVSAYAMDGRKRLGVMAVFNTGKSITPFRVVVPYDGVSVYPTDTENEFKSNIGMLFYGFNYYNEIKHLQDITHAQFTEALSMGLGAFARFMYEKDGDNSFGDDSFGVIMHFDFKKLPNHDYEISSPLDSLYFEFDEWIKNSDYIKLQLATDCEKITRVAENQVIFN